MKSLGRPGLSCLVLASSLPLACSSGGGTWTAPAGTPNSVASDAGGDGSVARESERKEPERSGPALVRVFQGFGTSGTVCLERDRKRIVAIPKPTVASMSHYHRVEAGEVDLAFATRPDATHCDLAAMGTFTVEKGQKYLLVPYLDDNFQSAFAVYPENPKEDASAVRLRFINLTYGWDEGPDMYIGETGQSGEPPVGVPVLEDVPYGRSGGSSSFGPVIDGFLYADRSLDGYITIYGTGFASPRKYILAPPRSFVLGKAYTVLQNGQTTPGISHPGTFVCLDVDDVGSTGTEFTECDGQFPNRYN